jgi:hypothetical protein
MEPAILNAIVMLAVVQLDANVVDREAGQHAARECFLDALVHGLDVFLRDCAALDLVFEDVAGARLAREQPDLHFGELAAATGLLRIPHLAVGRTGERFLVGDLRLADARLDAELALQTVNDDLEVQLAHAGDDHLAGLLVGLDAEGRVLGHELLQTVPELLLVALCLRLDRQRDDRLGEVHRLEDDRLLLIAERVAGAHLLQADSGSDVAGVDLLDFLTLVGVHLQEAAHTFGPALRRVIDP